MVIDPPGLRKLRTEDQQINMHGVLKVWGVTHERKRNLTNIDNLRRALSKESELSVVRAVMQKLPFVAQLYAVMYEVQVLVAAFGASLAWTAFLPEGSFVVQIHPSPEGAPHFGSCFSGWGGNPRSEWGAWARAAGIHYACVSKPATSEDRCYRDLATKRWDVDTFDAD